MLERSGPAGGPALLSIFGGKITTFRRLAGDATDTASLGVHFGDTLYEREVTYLRTVEWANSVESVLWRRSKLGFKIGDKGKKALKAWFDKKKTEAIPPIS